MRNLLLTGGWAHPFDRTAPVLAGVLAATGWRSTVVTSADDAADALGRGIFDLLTVYACQFQMKQARYTDDNRSQFARTTSPAARTGIGDWLDGGGALLAVHTAPICFDDWDAWPAYVGGAWDWARSWHPAPAPVEVRVTGLHPITEGLDRFTVDDERYCDLEVFDGSVVVTASPGDDGGQPSAWVVERGDGGRTVYDSLGHDERSLTHPAHARLLQRAAAWASRT